MNLKLAKGNHRLKDGGCLVEIVSMLLGRQVIVDGVLKPNWLWPAKTDAPPCISPIISHACQKVNDALPVDERQRLALLIPRILRARSMDHDVERRIGIRLTLWAARSAEHLLEPEILDRFHRALELSEAALWSDDVEFDDNHWELGWLGACHAAAQAGRFPLSAISGAIGTLDCGRRDDLVMWLDSLLDAWAKAVVEEGLALYDPTIDYPPDDEVQAVIDAILSSG
jgi:hypothetical protein